MKTLIINANPKKNSFSEALSQQYYKGATENGSVAELIHLHELDFEPVLRVNPKEQERESQDIIDIRKKISEADHLVFVFPVWWGTYPALLKGFIDNTFVSGFGFKYRDNSLRWDKLLKGKSARLIITMDTPKWYYNIIFGKPAINSMKKCVLKFCGISPVKTTVFTPVKKSPQTERSKWLNKCYTLGYKGK